MVIPTICIGLAILLSVSGALGKYRDTFHPTLLVGPILAFHYCYSPLVLYSTNGFFGYLADDDVAFAQWVHFLGVAAILVGMFLGSKTPPGEVNVPEAVYDRKKLFFWSAVFAGLGIGTFALGIANVGGLTQAYGEAYGSGSLESGWLRDLTLLCVPALILFSLSHQKLRLTPRYVTLMLIYASPFLIHGFLGARRGPTFMVVAGMALTYYMASGKRPRLVTMAAGGGALGILLLFLVTNRTSIYWGSDMKLEGEVSTYFNPSAGNDFVCGAGLVVITQRTGDFSWGATYLTTLFVRPIPRSIWPTKYEDAAAFFHSTPLTENLGIDITAFRRVLGWTATVGSAPGIVADIWREFSWGMVIVLGGLGWFYGYAWRRASREGWEWLAIYCYMASLSLYLVMQTLEAMLYRFLFGAVPMLLILRRARLSAAAADEAPSDLVTEEGDEASSPAGVIAG
jgi:oligosaccharide repeat unit polymerase